MTAAGVTDDTPPNHHRQGFGRHLIVRSRDALRVTIDELDQSAYP